MVESSLQLQTPRLVLRELTDNDAPALLTYPKRRDALYGMGAEVRHRVAFAVDRVRPDGGRGESCAHGGR